MASSCHHITRATARSLPIRRLPIYINDISFPKSNISNQGKSNEKVICITPATLGAAKKAPTNPGYYSAHVTLQCVCAIITSTRKYDACWHRPSVTRACDPSTHFTNAFWAHNPSCNNEYWSHLKSNDVIVCHNFAHAMTDDCAKLWHDCLILINNTTKTPFIRF